MFLDKRLRLIRKEVIAIGEGNVVSIDIKKILKKALKYNALNLVLAHNHPSGSKTPSENDVITTKRLIDAANTIEIKVIDHLICTNSGYYSFLEEHII